MIDRVVIVGAGSMARSLIQRLVSVAPVTVVDTAADAITESSEPAPTIAAATPPVARKASDPEIAVAEAYHPVERRVADGTSRLVLEDLRGDPTSSVALVAATGEDRINLEVCRLGGQLGFKPIVAVAIDDAARPQYEALDVRPIVRARLLGDVVLQSLRHDGVAVASNVGLGQGELIEIRILSSSPAIGQRLSDLNPDGWRVAAMYRANQLVIPRGSTTLRADDRVLLVGDPEILPHVAENLRIGLPDFPLRYGPNIVVYLPTGRDRLVEAAAEVMTLKTHARRLLRLHPGAEASRTAVGTGVGGEAKTFDDLPLVGSTLAEHFRLLAQQRPGLVVAKATGRGVRERLFGTGGRDTLLCNSSPVPVLFPGGDPHLSRIGMVVGGGTHDLRTADAAVDLARMLGLPLALLWTELPGYLGAADARPAQVVTAIEQRANLHGMRLTIERRVGNPIAEAARYAGRADLCVVARQRLVRDSFSSPDVAMRIVHAAACSTLVISV